MQMLRALDGLESASKGTDRRKLLKAIYTAERVFRAREVARSSEMEQARDRLQVLERWYTSFEALLEAVEDHTELVKGSWIVHHCERFKRRQDLPEEAFWDPSELRALVFQVEFVAIS